MQGLPFDSFFQQVTTHLFFAFRGNEAPVLPLATTGLLETNSAVSLGNSWKEAALVKDAGHRSLRGAEPISQQQSQAL